MAQATGKSRTNRENHGERVRAVEPLTPVRSKQRPPLIGTKRYHGVELGTPLSDTNCSPAPLSYCDRWNATLLAPTSPPGLSPVCAATTQIAGEIMPDLIVVGIEMPLKQLLCHQSEARCAESHSEMLQSR